MNKLSPVKIWLAFIVRMFLIAVALFWPAGTWHWWQAWVMIAIWTTYGVIMTLYLIPRDPHLLMERLKIVPLHKDQKSWDKFIMTWFFVAGVGLYIVPGFDVVRYGWSEPLPIWLQVVGMFLHLPCLVLFSWIMRENTFLSQVVKIDKARGHQVVTTGPYAWVRHPLYTVVIVLLFTVPLALGSRYAFLLTVFLTILLVIRTVLEDRTLHEELEGYADYAKQTPYRLIPGVW